MGSTGLARGLILPREPEVGFCRVGKRTDTLQDNQKFGSTGLARGLILPREPEVGFSRVSKRIDTPKRTRGWVLQG